MEWVYFRDSVRFDAHQYGNIERMRYVDIGNIGYGGDKLWIRKYSDFII